MTYTIRARVAAGLVAAIAWSAEALFYLAHVRTTGSLVQSAWLLLAYLTDWANLAVAIVCTAIALSWRRLSTTFTVALATAAILSAGTMWSAMGGWGTLARQDMSSVLAHAVVPPAMGMLWLLLGPHGRLRWADVPRLLVFPAAYLAQMVARGLGGGGWPYPQVDIAQVGWSGALLFAGVAMAVFLLIAVLLVAADRGLAQVGRSRRRIG